LIRKEQRTTLPLAHVAWRRAAVKAAAAFGGRALPSAAAVRAIAEACDCDGAVAREILAAAELAGLLRYRDGLWRKVPPC
jgi:hypothetical protein